MKKCFGWLYTHYSLDDCKTCEDLEACKAEFIGEEKVAMKDCFGSWLDTCYNGHEACRTCEDLEKCKDKFIDEVK